MNALNVTPHGRNVYNPLRLSKRYTGTTRNVYKPTTPLNVTSKRGDVTFMRVGQTELKILKILTEKEGRVSFYEVKQTLAGVGELKFRRMGYDKHHDISVQHKAIVRATKTLEEKGLIIRSGYVSPWDNSKLTRIKFLKITEKGKEEYLKRVGVA